MDGFNGWLREQELHDGFKMGIGLNTGPVMSGNVGSERRLEYTALGDTTNTAARLEGMTKGTPHQLYISDTTKQTLTRARRRPGRRRRGRGARPQGQGAAVVARGSIRAEGDAGAVGAGRGVTGVEVSRRTSR